MPVFVDTNVLVYARDTSEPTKQPLALRWLDQLWRRRQGRTSVQVLDEYYVTVTRKLDPGMSVDAARKDVRSLFTWSPVVLDAGLVEQAWRTQDRFDLSFWDSLIVAGALAQGCERLLTEDLQDGQDLGGVVVVNPFVRDPD